jgi:hypothetical protein
MLKNTLDNDCKTKPALHNYGIHYFSMSSIL